MLGADLLTLKNSSALEMRPTLPLIVAGSGVLQQAVATLIAEDDFFVAEVTVVTHAQQTHLAGYGAARVAAARGLLDFPIASPALALANSM